MGQLYNSFIDRNTSSEGRNGNECENGRLNSLTFTPDDTNTMSEGGEETETSSLYSETENIYANKRSIFPTRAVAKKKSTTFY
jgi:hypothetical protein